MYGLIKKMTGKIEFKIIYKYLNVKINKEKLQNPA